MEDNRQQRQSILVVDDEPGNIELLNETLQENYRIIFATNGPDALSLVATQKPDLILLDIMMPEMDGREVCKRLKQDNDLAEVPVIFVTAMSDEQDETAGLALGAVDYLTKPINPTIVQLRVKNHLELKRIRDELATQHQYLQALIASSQDIFLSFDNEMSVIEFNPAAEVAFGYIKSEMVGQHMKILYTDSNHSDMVEVMTSTRGKHTGEVTLKKKNGDSFPVFLTTASIVDASGNNIGIVSSGRDLTKEKMINKMLQAKKNGLPKI